METQTIINIVFALSFIAYIIWSRNSNSSFDAITRKEWKSVDKKGHKRTKSTTDARGAAGVEWFEKEWKRQLAEPGEDGSNYDHWFDIDRKRGSQARSAASFKTESTIELTLQDEVPPKA